MINVNININIHVFLPCHDDDAPDFLSWHCLRSSAISKLVISLRKINFLRKNIPFFHQMIPISLSQIILLKEIFLKEIRKKNGKGYNFLPNNKMSLTNFYHIFSNLITHLFIYLTFWTQTFSHLPSPIL